MKKPHCSFMRTQLNLIGIILVTGLLSGCGHNASAVNYDGVQLIDVNGTVTLDGSPVKGAVVSFVDEQTTRMSWGVTGEDGTYRLNFDRQKHGVTPGNKIVKISTSTLIEGVNDSATTVDEETGESQSKEQIPAQYNKESELKAVVDENNKEFNFELKSS